MKIVCISGSPRKNGNCITMMQEIVNIAEKANAEIQNINLNQLNYKGCQACMSCKTGKEDCVLDDDLKDVLTAIKDCDVVALASPVYFGEVTAQMKGLIDRMYAYLVPNFKTAETPGRIAPGKTVICILPQGQPDEKMFGDIFPKYDNFLKFMGFSNTHLVRACGVMEAGAVKNREDLLEKVRSIAQNIIQ